MNFKQVGGKPIHFNDKLLDHKSAKYDNER